MLLVAWLLPIALVALAIAAKWPGRRGAPIGVALAALAAVWCASLPVTAHWLVRTLGSNAPLDPAALSGAQAIVAIGGGLRANAPEYGGVTLGRLTAERVRYAAHLARLSGLPVLVSGGRPRDDVPSEASLMGRALREEYGGAARWIEDASINTRTNAQESARLLARDGVRRIVLVAHAFDMPRAAREFRAVGFVVIEAPTGVDRPLDYLPGDFTPHLVALERTNYVLYELLATIVNALRPPAIAPDWAARGA